MITPIEYVNDCCPQCYPVGALFCQVKEDAPILEWTEQQIKEANNLIIERYENGSRFPFPNKVRYV